MGDEFEKVNYKNYVVRRRRGKDILVDKQILRWRKKRKKLLENLNQINPPETPNLAINVFQEAPKGVPASSIPNLFIDDSE